MASISPDVEPMVATTVLPLLHIPPPDASLKETKYPVQLIIEPDMGNGIGFTDITTEALQPVESI